MRGFPRCRPGHKGRHVRGVRAVRLRKSASDVRLLALHGRCVDQDEEGNHEQQQRPMRRDCKPSGDKEAAEVERISAVGVGAGRGEPFVLGDVARGPGTDDDPYESDHSSHGQGQQCRSRENQIGDAEYEAEGKADALGDLGISQSASSFSRCLAMTRRWISEVPSPISQIFASRNIRSTGYSFV